jgi:hypothetical protein
LEQLELFLLSEEHGEADNGSVDEETASDAHDHGLDADLLGVSQDNGKSCDRVLVRVLQPCLPFHDPPVLPICPSQCSHFQRTNSHYNEESSHESPQLHDTAATRVHKVIVRLGFAAYPVGHWREDVCCYDQESEEVVVEGGGEDNEDEADGKDLIA